jgi:acetyltransferase-like isoleucine patch superfamily enzyme
MMGLKTLGVRSHLRRPVSGRGLKNSQFYCWRVAMIHPTAIVSAKAHIGQNVNIGPFTIIYENAIIGEGTTIESFCEIGYPSFLAEGRSLIIGANSLIRSHSLFYQGSAFGDGLVTGHRVTVRENVIAGVNLQIGTLADLQGDCEIGNYVRTHSRVFIAKQAKIGNFVWIMPCVALTNDPHPPSNCVVGVTVEDYVVIATMSVILPGITLGQHSLVAAHSLVNRDVKALTVVGGSPAKKICEASEIKLRDGSGRNAYPWPAHFHRGYPEQVIRKWVEKYR